MPVKFLVAHNARSDCGGLESSRSRRPTRQWMAIFVDKREWRFIHAGCILPASHLDERAFRRHLQPPEARARKSYHNPEREWRGSAAGSLLSRPCTSAGGVVASSAVNASRIL